MRSIAPKALLSLRAGGHPESAQLCHRSLSASGSNALDLRLRERLDWRFQGSASALLNRRIKGRSR